MNEKQNRNISKHDVARQCITHLSREIELLERYIDFANSIYGQLGLPPTLTESLSGNDPMQSLARQSEQLTRERGELKTVLGDYLGVPADQATVRALLDGLDAGHSQTIRQQRARLKELESTIQKHNRTQSFLIRQSLDLYHQIAMELMDQKPGAPTYSSSGRLSPQDATNILKTDC